MVLILIIITVLWTPDILNYYTTGNLPAAITVDGVHTLIIPFQDFSIVMPLALITMWLVRRGEKWGYILAPVVLVKALSKALAVLGMIVFMQLSGTPANLGQAMVFVIGAAVIGAYTRSYFRGIEITTKSGSY
jgi:hypothetical protein